MAYVIYFSNILITYLLLIMPLGMIFDSEESFMPLIRLFLKLGIICSLAGVNFILSLVVVFLNRALAARFLASTFIVLICGVLLLICGVGVHPSPFVKAMYEKEIAERNARYPAEFEAYKQKNLSYSNEAMGALYSYKKNLLDCLTEHMGNESFCDGISLPSTENFDYKFEARPLDGSNMWALIAYGKRKFSKDDKISLSSGNEGPGIFCYAQNKMVGSCDIADPHPEDNNIYYSKYNPPKPPKVLTAEDNAKLKLFYEREGRIYQFNKRFTNTSSFYKLGNNSPHNEAIDSLLSFKENLTKCFEKNIGNEASCGDIAVPPSTTNFDYWFLIIPRDGSRAFQVVAVGKGDFDGSAMFLEVDENGDTFCSVTVGKMDGTCSSPNEGQLEESVQKTNQQRIALSFIFDLKETNDGFLLDAQGRGKFDNKESNYYWKKTYPQAIRIHFEKGSISNSDLQKLRSYIALQFPKIPKEKVIYLVGNGRYKWSKSQNTSDIELDSLEKCDFVAIDEVE